MLAFPVCAEGDLRHCKFRSLYFSSFPQRLLQDDTLNKTWPILSKRSKFLVDEVALLQAFFGELRASYVNSLFSDTPH